MAKGDGKFQDALLEFIQAIEATGGVKVDDHGYHVPMADEDWIDLGAAYMRACEAIQHEPLVSDEEEEEENL